MQVNMNCFKDANRKKVAKAKAVQSSATGRKPWYEDG